MRQYIINLTDNLIGKNKLDQQFVRQTPGNFITDVALSLEVDDLQKMSPETLGKILGQLEIGDVMASRDELFSHVHFNGDCEDTLRDLVAICLAYIICDRLDGRDPKTPRYKGQILGVGKSIHNG